MESLSVDLISTTKNKPSLLVDGYQYRMHRKTEKYISWVCSKDKKEKCKGNIKTDFEHNVMNVTFHSCVANEAKLQMKQNSK